MKIINVKGIAVLLCVLLALHLILGLIVSPMAGKIVLEYSNAEKAAMRKELELLRAQIDAATK